LAAAALLIVGVSASYYLDEHFEATPNETVLKREQWIRYNNYNDKLRQLLKPLGEFFWSYLENSPDYSNSENGTELCFWIEFTCGNGNCIRKSSYGFQQACPIIEELL